MKCEQCEQIPIKAFPKHMEELPENTMLLRVFTEEDQEIGMEICRYCAGWDDEYD